MISGIYCYYDDVKHRVAYIGKDSNIDKNRRHKQHYYPYRKNEQDINTVLQNNLENNNINRYTYVVLEKSDDWTNEDLNEKEKYYISLFKPKFNFTEGGDGAGSGENNPNWKNYARVIKAGTTRNGKQIYALRYNGEDRVYGINKEELEELADRINKLENKDEEIVNQIIEEYKTRKTNYAKTNYATVIKVGFTHNGKQQYALKYNGKHHAYNINKEELEEVADRINKLENKDEEIVNQIIEEYKARRENKNKKNYATVIKHGFTPHGKQNYALVYNGENRIYDINKKELEEVADKINKLENKDEEIINQIIEEYKARRENKNKKNYATVVKCGFRNGKQNYALKQNGKIKKQSIYKEKLEKEAEERNKNIINKNKK